MRPQRSALLLLLAASVLANISLEKKKKKSNQQRYHRFVQQHINETMTELDCGSAMTRVNSGTKCKCINTFVLAAASRVKAVCTERQAHGDFTRSRDIFSIVVCESIKQPSKPPKCRYHGARLNRRQIIISCQDELPVHYEGDVARCEAEPADSCFVRPEKMHFTAD